MNSITIHIIRGVLSILMGIYLLSFFIVYLKVNVIRKNILLIEQLPNIIFCGIEFPLMVILLFNPKADGIPLDLISIWLFSGIVQVVGSHLFSFLFEYTDLIRGRKGVRKNER